MSLIIFSDKKKRLAHPQAQFLPDSLWQSPLYFYNGIDTRILNLMQETDDEKRLNELKQFVLQKDKKRVWIALACRQPQLSHEMLRNLASELRLSLKDQLELACTWGNVSYFEYFANKALKEEKDLFEDGIYSYSSIAASSGNIEILKYLKQQTSPEEWMELIQNNFYFLFRMAACDGHLQVLQYLEEQVPQEELQKMIQAMDYEASKLAAENGHIDVLKYLVNRASSEQKIQMHSPFNYKLAFNEAAGKGHLKALEYIQTLGSIEALQTQFKSTKYEGFQNAASGGFKEILIYLGNLFPSQHTAMLQAGKYKAFCNAALYGHLELLDYFETVFPAKRQEMLKALEETESWSSGMPLKTFQYLEKCLFREGVKQQMPKKWQESAFFHAASTGNMEAFQYFERHLSADEFKGMIVPELFTQVACAGYLDVLKYFETQIDKDMFQSRIKEGNYALFRYAAIYGHLEVLKYLVNKNLLEVSCMIFAIKYVAFRRAAANGHLHVLEYFQQLVSKGRLEIMIREQNYEAFREAAANGHLSILDYLKKQSSEVEWLQMIRAVNYEAFRYAAAHGDIDVLRYLEQQVSKDELLQMIRAKNYEAFHNAIAGGHPDILKYLEQQVSKDELLQMIRAKNYEAFRLAGAHGHLNIMKYLVQQVSLEEFPVMLVAENQLAQSAFILSSRPKVIHYLLGFNYALNAIEANLVSRIKARPHFDQLLTGLRSSIAEATKSKTLYEYELSAEVAERYYYCLRNLIRRDKPVPCKDITLLLRIPAIKRRAFTGSIQYAPNELLRIAHFTKNQEVINLLFPEELRGFARRHFQSLINADNWKIALRAWEKINHQKELTQEESAILKSLDIKPGQEATFIKSQEKRYQWPGEGNPWLEQTEQAFAVTSIASLSFAAPFRQQFLQEIFRWMFLSLVTPLVEKQDYYLKHNLPKHAAAQQLIDGLKSKADRFYQTNDLSSDALQGFKAQCIGVLQQHSPVLEEHATFLGALFAAVHQFFIALKAVLFNEPKKYGFFDSRSDGGKIVGALNDGIVPIHNLLHSSLNRC